MFVLIKLSNDMYMSIMTKMIETMAILMYFFKFELSIINTNNYKYIDYYKHI
jgi:hypothetical protein